jgi:hypothetical protein
LDNLGQIVTTDWVTLGHFDYDHALRLLCRLWKFGYRAVIGRPEEVFDQKTHQTKKRWPILSNAPLQLVDANDLRPERLIKRP